MIDTAWWILGIILVVVFILQLLRAQRAERELNGLRDTLNSQVHEQVAAWRDRELDAGARERATVLLQQWRIEAEHSMRQDAIRRSQSVTTGRVLESVAAYLPDFPFNPKDVRFLGTPIDLVIFDGLSSGAPKEIVSAEVKSGHSGLTTRERAVRDLVEQKRVRWWEYQISVAEAPEPPRQGEGSPFRAGIYRCSSCGKRNRVLQPTPPDGVLQCSSCHTLLVCSAATFVGEAT